MSYYRIYLNLKSCFSVIKMFKCQKNIKCSNVPKINYTTLECLTSILLPHNLAVNLIIFFKQNW